MLEETVRDWGRKLRRQGRKEGRQEGRREGRREGRQEGRVEGMRAVILQVLTQRFGRVPVRARRRVEELSSHQELRELARKALVAESLRELGLG